MRCDRVNRIGGGVIVWGNKLLGKAIKCDVTDKPVDIEVLILSYPEAEVILCVLYIPPDLPRDTNRCIKRWLINTLDDVLLLFPASNLFVCGDLNSSFMRQELSDLLNAFDLANLITTNTTATSSIDVMVCHADLFDAFKPIEISPPLGNSDHFTCTLYPTLSTPVNVQTKLVMDLRHSHISNFVNKVANSHLNLVMDIPNLDAKVSYFYHCLHSCMTVIPKRKLEIRDNDPPWFTTTVYDIKRKKDLAFFEGNPQLVRHFTTKLEQEISRAKQTCLSSARNAHETWGLYHAFTKGSSQTPIYNITRKFNSSQEGLDAIGCIFQQAMGNSTNQAISGSSINTSTNNVIEMTGDGFTYSTPFQVLHYMDSLKPHGTGADGIPNKLYKSVAHIVAEPLSNIINASFDSCVVPNDFKLASIVPLPKTSVPDITELRPISLLPIPGKCLEHCALATLKSIILPLIDKQQFAYQKMKSTCVALILVIDEISRILDEGDDVLLQAFDLSKAFDTVPHDLLIQKLYDAKVPNKIVLWLKSYLSDRRFRVGFGGVFSRDFIVLSGVPQGSLIGPILFIFYMAGLTGMHSLLVKFADDITSIVRLRKGTVDIFTDASTIESYCLQHNLKMNKKKSQQMIISTKAKTNYKLPDDIPVTSQIKILGVIIDARLTFKPFFEIITRRAVSRLTILRQLRSTCDRSALFTIFRCCILSLFDYCAPLFVSVPAYIEEMTQSVCDRAERIITSGNSRHSSICVKSRKLDIATNLFMKVISEPRHPLHFLLPERQVRSGRFMQNFARLSLRQRQFMPFMTQFVNNHTVP